MSKHMIPPLTKEHIRIGIINMMAALEKELLRRLETGAAFQTLLVPRPFTGHLPLSEMIKSFLDIAVIHSAAALKRSDAPIPEGKGPHYWTDRAWDEMANVVHNIIAYQIAKRHEDAWNTHFKKEGTPPEDSFWVVSDAPVDASKPPAAGEWAEVVTSDGKTSIKASIKTSIEHAKAIVDAANKPPKPRKKKLRWPPPSSKVAGSLSTRSCDGDMFLVSGPRRLKRASSSKNCSSPILRRTLGGNVSPSSSSRSVLGRTLLN